MDVARSLHVPSIFSWNKVKHEAVQLWERISRHEVFMMAGSLAYTTALALAPFIVIMLSVAALLGQNLQNQLYGQVTSLMGAQAGAVVKLVVENADNNQQLSGVSGLIGFLVLVVSASAIFSQLRTILDKIDERTAAAQDSGVWSFIKDKFLSIGLVFGFVFLAITSLMVTTTLSVVLPDNIEGVWILAAYVASFVVFLVLFTLIFHFVPSEKMTWRRSFISGLWGTLFFMAGKSLIGAYLGNASIGSAYGAAGSFVVFLVWVYYTTLTLLISYEFTNSVILDEAESEAGYT